MEVKERFDIDRHCFARSKCCQLPESLERDIVGAIQGVGCAIDIVRDCRASSKDRSILYIINSFA
jgi:hypothetical protein